MGRCIDGMAERGIPLLARPGSVIPLAADDQCPVSVRADGVGLRVHAFGDGARRRGVIPRMDGFGETARFDIRREGDRLRITTDSPHPWRLRIGGPGGIVHTNTAGRATTDFRYEH